MYVLIKHCQKPCYLCPIFPNQPVGDAFSNQTQQYTLHTVGCNKADTGTDTHTIVILVLAVSIFVKIYIFQHKTNYTVLTPIMYDGYFRVVLMTPTLKKHIPCSVYLQAGNMLVTFRKYYL